MKDDVEAYEEEQKQEALKDLAEKEAQLIHELAEVNKQRRALEEK